MSPEHGLHDDESYREFGSEAIHEFVSGVNGSGTEWATELYVLPVHWQGTAGRFSAGCDRKSSKLKSENNLPGNRVFYLAITRCICPNNQWTRAARDLNESAGWTRLVIEKPFGHNLETAQQLNATVHANFKKSRSIASTITWAKKPCKTCWHSDLQIRFLSLFGIAIGYRMSRLQLRKNSAWERAPATTTGLAPCAIWCKTT